MLIFGLKIKLKLEFVTKIPEIFEYSSENKFENFKNNEKKPANSR